ncbi:MAG: hypothetical protein Q4Q22_07150, partial [Methanosphaera sp.]|nr:hypothetical protein [Methanosphaera sp.]
MTKNKKQCLLFLAVIVTLLLGSTALSATDNLQELNDTQKLSAPSNYDADNVVQSEMLKATSDANVETISTSTENTLNSKSSENTITNTDITKSVLENSKNIKSEPIAGAGTFAQLQQLISQSTGTLTLTGDYQYDSSDEDTGIVIDKSIIINGDG